MSPPNLKLFGRADRPHFDHAYTPSPTTKRQRHPRTGGRLGRREMSAEDIPHPPPPYTPTIALHAATLAPGAEDPSLVSENAPDKSQVATHSHVGLLVGVILAGTIIAIVGAITLVVFIKNKRLRAPFCSPGHRRKKSTRHTSQRMAWMSKRSTTASTKEKLPSPHADDLRAQVSNVLGYDGSRSAGASPELQSTDRSIQRPLLLGGPSNWGSELPLRRFSLPSLRSDLSSRSLAPESQAARPLSMPSADRELISVQQQRLTELAQIQRMKFLEDSPTRLANKPTPPISRRSSMVQGLGIIPEELEVDIGSTALSNLEYFPFLADETSADSSAPLSSNGNENNVFRRPQSNYATPTRPMSSLYSEPMSLVTMDSGSSMSETDVLEDDIGEVQTARTHSVEIKRGVLVSLHGSVTSVPQFVVSTPSVRSSMGAASIDQSVFSSHQLLPDSVFLDTKPNVDTFTKTMSNFPSPPPMLSPILTSSSFELSAEIERGLGSKVSDYRNSAAFGVRKASKESQLLALADALDWGGASYKPSVIA